MMLLSGCKIKHSDYTPSSGLSSSVVFSDLETFLLAPNLYIRLVGRLVGPQQKVDGFSKFWRQLTGKNESWVMYYFEVCSKEEPQQPQRCINPFKQERDTGRSGKYWHRNLSFYSDSIIEILLKDRAGDIYPGSTPYIEYIEKGGDGKYRTVSYFNFDKAKVKSVEDYYSYMRPKEEYLQTPGTGKALKIPIYEITARDLMKVAYVIKKLAGNRYMPKIYWVCHPHPSINCTNEIEHKDGTNTLRYDWRRIVGNTTWRPERNYDPEYLDPNDPDYN